MNVVTARSFAFALVLSLGIASSALASAPQAAADFPSFDEMDKNKDGIVTLPEIMVYPDPVAKIIQSCDTNHDSKLTREEYASCKAILEQAVKPAK